MREGNFGVALSRGCSPNQIIFRLSTTDDDHECEGDDNVGAAKKLLLQNYSFTDAVLYKILRFHG